MTGLDHTHDGARRSWVASADGHADFPLQNLPLGICSIGGSGRLATAIGDLVLDLAGAREARLLSGAAAEAVTATDAATLNGLFALGPGLRRALREQVFALLAEGSPARDRVEGLLRPAAECPPHLPAAIGDYTDFYAGIHHAVNVGRLFRPDEPLLPNYKHVPIGYHGRASSVVPSGTAIRRPSGQRKPAGEPAPSFGPSRNLDYELELGIWIGGGNALGEPIPIGQAGEAIAGYGLLNDWSARDIQGWEYQPLGPFLAKSFATTVSPWVITPEALAPFRTAQATRPAGDPTPMDHLADAEDQRTGALDLDLEVWLLTRRMRESGAGPHRVATSSARHLYWTPAQMVAHHTSGGCNLRPGDLFGSGTISAPVDTGYGSLLETTEGGRKPLRLPSGETRRFLEDGDEVILRAFGRRDGFATIGFGACRGIVTAS